jgi:two-component system chemotaxis response regulator CheB
MGRRLIVMGASAGGHAAMPASALAQVPGALVHPAAKFGPVLGELVSRPGAAAPVGNDELLRAETRIAATGVPTTDALAGARPSAFSCPNCHGVLFELPGAPAPRFRCRVGHAWSPGALEAEQAHAVYEAHWAVRALEEKADLVERLTADARGHGRTRSAAAYALRAARTRGQAQQLRGLVEAGWAEREQGGGASEE